MCVITIYLGVYEHLIRPSVGTMQYGAEDVTPFDRTKIIDAANASPKANLMQPRPESGHIQS